VPEILLPPRSRYARLFILVRSGIVEVKWLSLRSKYDSIKISPMKDGMELVSKLPARFKYCRALRDDKKVGTVKVSDV